MTQNQLTINAGDNVTTGVIIGSSSLPNGTILNQVVSVTTSGVGATIIGHIKNLKVTGGQLIGDLHVNSGARSNALDIEKVYAGSNVALSYSGGNLFLTQ